MKILVAGLCLVVANGTCMPAATAQDAVPLPLVLPGADSSAQFYFWSDTQDLPRRLQEGWSQPQPMPLVPSGVRNLALHAPVSSSDGDPVIGGLAMITDGDKSPERFVELAAGTQWVQIDLASPAELWAIAVWHFHSRIRIYQAVVIQVADDALCSEHVRTLFNNDEANAVGRGVGTDAPYPDTYQGRVIPCLGTRARYVRCWSHGNNRNQFNHYLEVEVWGR